LFTNKKPAELCASAGLKLVFAGYLSRTPPPSRYARDGGDDDDDGESA
jgi:hypothetical protein